ncbi:hypothetical protein N6N71_21255 [Escherichia albertii]|uniref:hypothetical protein n=1 Tax=Escherichia TaxID=561 RepID=UPI000B7E8776|nr:MULTISPECIES: hypothetical protein [Escherichia]ECT6020487.1 hypothetical protein [Salmonella enterica subsp. enterica serovar Infantis]ECV9595284.1 hypothetical protein [Salmonella enterica subsp. enterica serovar Typhimurium]EFD2249462.1 hypothetical protein [Escherichia coli]EFJ3724141.1 hypothetical protein [Escherichia coli]ELN0876292.1 hypothetical protein [Escherichia coli]
MENYAKFVATEILNQLGGNRFIAMTGAKNFAYFDEDGECGLSFRLPSKFAMNGINLVKIKLTFSDTYQVTFSGVRGAMVKEVSTFDNVYCDQLECLFNEQTGLATRL